MRIQRTTRTLAELPMATISAGSVHYHFLPGGALRDAVSDGIQLNSYLGTPFDLPVANVYLRLHGADGIVSTPLLGPGAVAVTAGENGLIAERRLEPVAASLSLFPGDDGALFWSLEVINQGTQAVRLDALFYFPVGLAAPGALLNNESYVSQYVDHTIYQQERCGAVICSRQNLAQNNAHPWLLSSVLTGGVGALTDGFDFYGLSARENGEVAALSREFIGNLRRQYECGCHALQSTPLELAPGNSTQVIFFQQYLADHDTPTTPADLNYLPSAIPARPTVAGTPFDARPTLFSTALPLIADSLSPEAIQRLFPGEHRQQEFVDGRCGSFFYERSKHVVLKEKELRTMRTHGLILRADEEVYPGGDIASATLWMNGVFNSHFAFGNVNLQMGTGVQRGMLNFLRSAGTRAFVRRDGRWHLLGVPSAFEMDLDRCRWIYQIGEETLTVCCEALDREKAFRLRFESERPMELLVSTGLLFGGSEYAQALPVELAVEKRCFRIFPAAGSPVAEVAPRAAWQLSAEEENVSCGTAELFGGDERDPFAVFQTSGKRVTLYYTGRETAAGLPEPATLASAVADGAFWRDLCGDISFYAKESSTLSPLAEVLPWFVHDGMIHYATPYGLEQFVGAAWGVRDVCQGPVELLLALGRPEAVRRTILKVFEHQYENGTWPQWFMFDGYYRIQQSESHGDIPVWPLKAVCDYLEATGDFAILDAPVCHTLDDYTFSGERATLREHLMWALAYVKQNFIPGTCLLSYGNGDWNDSLQPAQRELKRSMVSSWTVALLIQTLRRWAKCMEYGGDSRFAGELSSLAERVLADFRRHLLRDGVVAGFGIHRADGEFDLLLHPSDSTTGIHYRLLPSTRSMIAECFTRDEAFAHLAMIRNHLLLADGAHLMDAPPQYRGGESRFFQRAETASFFGREVGLNYTHAHIRYLEALARLGEGRAMLHGLFTACPVALRRTVFQADFRQSNAYFSSSDCDAADRYEIQENYHEVRTGSRRVNGGWRVYSSGPGMYVALLLTRFFGIRHSFGRLVIDPVIPAGLGECELNWTIAGHPVTIVFSPRFSDPVRLNGEVLVAIGREENPYRTGGLLFDEAVVIGRLGDENRLEVKL